MVRVNGFSHTRWIATVIVAAALALPPRLDAQGPGQDIKVHGHWVIEVRNADGTLQVRREFENALLPGGQQLLARLLSAQTNMGIWAVIVIGLPCVNAGGSAAFCQVTEPSHPSTAGANIFKNLTKTVTGAFELVLQGSLVVVANPGSVTGLRTRVDFVDNTGSLAGGLNFTERTLDSPISVEVTQSVSVTVTISFS